MSEQILDKRVSTKVLTGATPLKKRFINFVFFALPQGGAEPGDSNSGVRY